MRASSPLQLPIRRPGGWGRGAAIATWAALLVALGAGCTGGEIQSHRRDVAGDAAADAPAADAHSADAVAANEDTGAANGDTAAAADSLGDATDGLDAHIDLAPDAPADLGGDPLGDAGADPDVDGTSPDPCAGHCSNGATDCGESGLDCGGECSACAPSCAGHCDNDRVDCGETGLDCGGECPACTAGTDDAAVASQTLPGALACGATTNGTVTMENTGTTTWYRDDLEGYKLGYVGDLGNVFLPAPPGNIPRVLLDEGETVAPGELASFSVPLRAPAAAGTYTAELQMVWEGVHWFGDVASASVSVSCEGGGGGCSFPQGLPEAAYHYNASGTDAAVAQAVNEVMAELSGCSSGSACYIGDRYTDQTWFAAVNEALRERGFCAGQHEEGHTDEIAVGRTGCTGAWYGYHVFNYGGQLIVWNPGAQRGYYTIDAEWCP